MKNSRTQRINSLYEHPVQYIKGIGPVKARLLACLGIHNVKNALFYLPYRYEDRRQNYRIAELTYHKLQTITGKIVSAEVIQPRSGKLKIFELTITDGSGVLRGKWFNQPFMKKLFKPGERVILSGMVKRDSYWGVGYEMHNPEYEIVSDEHDSENIHTSRIVPIYRTTAGLSTRLLRSIMFSILNFASGSIEEYMPDELLRRHNLPPLRETLLNIHFPDGDAGIEELNSGTSPYHRRLSFDELFFLQSGLAVIRRGLRAEKGIQFSSDGSLIRRLVEGLPFRLTSAQQRVFEEIRRDMERPVPMNRLLQGDVGAGKTIVAVMAMLNAVESGYQTAIMAPTEILAEQHYYSISSLVGGIGVRCTLLTGSRKDKPFEEITKGETDIVIGTHALIQEGVRFWKLGLVVIDEQHRFGVMQRATLRKKGMNPDVLVMTATPIPRTLSLTLYGDLDYSVIDELPPKRMGIITRLFYQQQKGMLYSLIQSETKKGRQAYIVYPAIEESEKVRLRSAIPSKEAFKKVFPDLRIGLIHGRMKAREREEVMQAFKSHEIDVLVCTSVIEVGVDVPNASLMLVVHAERFGLAQLHQLRGRVGRGPYQSYCLLLAYGRLSEEAGRRLQVMVRESDGFRIAEEDFQIRGPGEFFGTKQSGMPDLRVANLIRDTTILSIARDESFDMIDGDPLLSRHPLLRSMVEGFWRGKIEIFRTG